MTPIEKDKAGRCDMFVVCLDCGQRFHYDWERMRSGKREGVARRPKTARPGKEVV